MPRRYRLERFSSRRLVYLTPRMSVSLPFSMCRYIFILSLSVALSSYAYCKILPGLSLLVNPVSGVRGWLLRGAFWWLVNPVRSKRSWALDGSAEIH